MIETVLAWLAGWWPLMALPGAFVVGFGVGYLLHLEDMKQANASVSRGLVAVTKATGQIDVLTEANAALADQVAVYKRDWQALRAIVEQHTVRQEKA